MTYLNSPRLHFAGRFRADLSTVNNYVTHFQDPDDPDDPGWNPRGTGRWALVDCKVTRAVYQDGTIAETPEQDPVIGLGLNQIDTAVLVDLDPQQQMVSQIWGLRMQLSRPGSPATFRGAFKTTAFSDLWRNRARVDGGGDLKMTAFYHSVLTGVVWGDLAGSRLAAELQQDSDAGLLSIKFNVDGFDQRVHVGRIVGTIGPAHADEPAHFVRGRHCMPRISGPVWYFPALIDAQRGKLIADFGNALQTTSVGGPSIRPWPSKSAPSPATCFLRWARCRSVTATGTNRPPGCASFPPIEVFPPMSRTACARIRSLCAKTLVQPRAWWRRREPTVNTCAPRTSCTGWARTRTRASHSSRRSSVGRWPTPNSM
jgi:hypothetical protein